MKASRIMVLTTAIITILCCLIGLFFHSIALIVVFSGAYGIVEDRPYFYQAFYIMFVICTVFYLCLLWFSIDFIRGHFRTVIPYTGVLIIEVVYFISIIFLCNHLLPTHPQIGRSIAGALGKANGGLIAQFIILLPLWAPIVLLVAKRKQKYEATS